MPSPNNLGVKHECDNTLLHVPNHILEIENPVLQNIANRSKPLKNIALEPNILKMRIVIKAPAYRYLNKPQKKALHNLANIVCIDI